MEYLKTLYARAGLGSWETWALQYRVLVVTLGLFALHWLMRNMGPTVLRILRPFLLLAFVLAVLWAVYPAEMCSIEFLSKLPILCGR